MKRSALRILAIALALASTLAFGPGKAFALDLDRSEIESAKDKKIVFVSYEGPQSRIDSLADIKSIGSGLGRSIAALPAAPAGTVAAGAAGDSRRYRIVRAVDPSESGLFDADILILGPDAQVDHIRNLRWIIAGYLVASWGYSEKDAYLVATFITVYNAVYRGDMNYIQSKYKKAVLKEIAEGTAGLSTRYTDWPGKTSILIPLSSGAKKGSLGAVDTGAVADKAVTENLRTESDKGIPDRQAMVSLKEREAAQKQAEADALKAEAAKAEAAVAAEKAKVEAARASLEADKAAKAAAAQPAVSTAAKPAAQPVTAPATTPAKTAAAPPAEAPATAAPAKTEAAPAATATPAAAPEGDAQLAKREAEVAASEKAVAAKETEVAAKKEEAAKTEEAAAAKKEEAASDRKDITADQKSVIAAEVAAKGEAEKAGIHLLRLIDDTSDLAQIIFADAEKGSLIRSSRLTSIHARSVVDSGDSFYAVAGKESGSGAVRVVRVDKATLESVESAFDVFPGSLVWKVGDRLFAVAKGSDGKHYLLRFAPDLAEAARSADAVNPWSYPSEAAGGVVVQTAAGGFAQLVPDSLEKTKEMKP